MTCTGVLAYRDVLSKLGALFCLLLVVSLLDAVIGKFREPSQVFHALPGEVIPLTGPMSGNDQTLDDLAISSESAALQVSADAIRPGFWMGGAMWHARITVGPNATPGEYKVRIHPREIPAHKVQSFHIIVHSDAADYQRSSTSFIQRALNVSPWWLMALFAACALAIFLVVFMLSNRIDHCLAEEGRAEIYLVRPVDGRLEIAFGLGSRNGVEAGTQHDIFDRTGRWIGFADVRKVTESDGLAEVRGDCQVDPESMVVKHGAVGGQS